MKKMFTGFCDVQKKEYTIEVEMINMTALSDTKENTCYGQITCEYASKTGKCDGRKCSVLGRTR